MTVTHLTVWNAGTVEVEPVSAFMLGFSCHTATRYYRCTATTPLLSYRSLKFPLGLLSHYTITVMNSKQIWRLCVCMRTGSFNKPFRYYRIIFQLHCINILVGRTEFCSSRHNSWGLFRSRTVAPPWSGTVLLELFPTWYNTESPCITTFFT